MNSDLFEKIRLFRGGGEGSRTPPDPDRSRVKRVLFGPPDHEANRRFVEEELAKGQREMSERYNFDFINGQPLEGRYLWFSGPLPPTSASNASGDKENVASTTSTERDDQKENSSLGNVSNSASHSVTAPATTVTSPATTSASAAAAASSSTNSSCDIPQQSNSCSRSSSSSTSSQKSSSAASRHSSRKITGTKDLFTILANHLPFWLTIYHFG